MKVDYINPFIKSSLNFFKDYLEIDIESHKAYIEKNPEEITGISAIIGLAGEIKGQVVLNFSRETAISLASIFGGTQYRAVSKDVVDVVGEMVNIIAGAAKQYLEQRIEISLPGVVFGDSYRFAWGGTVPVIAIPFTTQYGRITIYVSIKE
ncbi:chemotaxis protein CheX [Breznakiella homolactica]|uniref:Chemotaxis protein CheX n=1 Tax=Breznakiella homolactica TaxID=2798577 RepID=A0A7T7XRK4_9SPIR|nr:chemotaxis protein CheX [Breznakiella homolactica]QQO11202.1 chemotaxis protein CheX [Breznakiella homolactica]